MAKATAQASVAARHYQAARSAAAIRKRDETT